MPYDTAKLRQKERIREATALQMDCFIAAGTGFLCTIRVLLHSLNQKGLLHRCTQ